MHISRRPLFHRSIGALVALAAFVALSTPVVALAQTSPTAGITTVEVFANSAMVITPTNSNQYRLVVYRMDAMEYVRQSINQQIPRGGEQVARAWIVANKDRLKREVKPAAAAAANAINLAHYYKLDRLPAIVINRRVVVYGMTNVDAALVRYQATRSGGRP